VSLVEVPPPGLPPAEDDSFRFEGSPNSDGHAFHRHLCDTRRNAGAYAAALTRLHAVTRATYDAWSVEERAAFDGERERILATRAAFNTASLTRVVELVRENVRIADVRDASNAEAVGVIGAPGTGKSTAMLESMLEVASTYFDRHWGSAWIDQDPSSLRWWRRNEFGDRIEAQYVPVLPVAMPRNPTPRTFAQACLLSLARYIGDDALGRRNIREFDYTQLLIAHLAKHAVRVVYIDECHFITNDRMGLRVVDQFKSLMNDTRCVLVLAGLDDGSNPGFQFLTGVDMDGTKAQVKERLCYVQFGPFAGTGFDPEPGSASYEEWRQVVATMATRVVLLDQDAGWWREHETLDYLWKRTAGVFEALASLMLRAGRAAMFGPECLSIGFLERIEVSQAADARAASLHQLGPRVKRAGRKGRTARRSKNADARGRKRSEVLLSAAVASGVVQGATEDD